MKKLLLSLAFATALTAPALAGGRGADIEVNVSNSNDLQQVGVNNGAIVIQNVSGEEIELDDDAFEEIETALDLGDLEIQNVNYIIGDDSEIEGVQNINDDVAEGAAVVNGDLEVEVEVEVEIEVSLVNNEDNSIIDNSDNSTTDNSVNDNSVTNLPEEL